MLNKLWLNEQFRFLAVGLSNTLWGIVSFPILYVLLHSQIENYVLILTISYLLNTLISFVTQKIFVFKSKGNHLREFMKFSLLQVLIFSINLFFLPIAMKASGWGPVIPQIIFSFTVAVVSYFFHKQITFKIHPTI